MRGEIVTIEECTSLLSYKQQVFHTVADVPVARMIVTARGAAPLGAEPLFTRGLRTLHADLPRAAGYSDGFV